MQGHSSYDKTFASEFNKFLSGQALSTDHEDVDYMWYIEDHLKRRECPSFCSQLW